MKVVARILIVCALGILAASVTVPGLAIAPASEVSPGGCNTLEWQTWEDPYCCKCDFPDPELNDRLCVRDEFQGVTSCEEDPFAAVCWPSGGACQTVWN